MVENVSFEGVDLSGSRIQPLKGFLDKAHVEGAIFGVVDWRDEAAALPSTSPRAAFTVTLTLQDIPADLFHHHPASLALSPLPLTDLAAQILVKNTNFPNPPGHQRSQPGPGQPRAL